MKLYAVREHVYGVPFEHVVPAAEIDWRLCAERGVEPDEVVNTVPWDCSLHVEDWIAAQDNGMIQRAVWEGWQWN